MKTTLMWRTETERDSPTAATHEGPPTEFSFHYRLFTFHFRRLWCFCRPDSESILVAKDELMMNDDEDVALKVLECDSTPHFCYFRPHSLFFIYPTALSIPSPPS